jgi:hypothetical protein
VREFVGANSTAISTVILRIVKSRNKAIHGEDVSPDEARECWRATLIEQEVFALINSGDSRLTSETN